MRIYTLTVCKEPMARGLYFREGPHVDKKFWPEGFTQYEVWFGEVAMVGSRVRVIHDFKVAVDHVTVLQKTFNKIAASVARKLDADEA